MHHNIFDDVSRETLDRLEAYLTLLQKWNPKINLVSKSTLADAWGRHFVDSAQIFQFAPKDANNWLDLGSGGGFPGLVLSTLAMEKRPDLKVTLVESDARKSVFLNTVKRELNLTNTIVETSRIETLKPQNADVISARALASLTDLLGFSQRHLAQKGIALFPKGESWGKECGQAQEQWKFTYTAHKSVTDPDAVILEVRDLSYD